MISVSEAAHQLEKRGLLTRRRRKFEIQVIDFVSEQLGRPVPPELAEFYAENIDYICDAGAICPTWNPWVGFEPVYPDLWNALPDAVPLFTDGNGSLFGLDLLDAGPRRGVYFFDHIDSFKFPAWPAGSSLATFLLFLGDRDRALQEGWPDDWMEKIDPEIKNCPRVEPRWGWPED
jgi:hypothetical protein